MTCEKHCEATAYQIVIRNLENNLKKCTWVGLTDREKSNLWLESRAAIPRFYTYASLVEAKLRSKNERL